MAIKIQQGAGKAFESEPLKLVRFGFSDGIGTQAEEKDLRSKASESDLKLPTSWAPGDFDIGFGFDPR
jgi:hypothetical protein